MDITSFFHNELLQKYVLKANKFQMMEIIQIFKKSAINTNCLLVKKRTPKNLEIKDIIINNPQVLKQ